MTKTIHYAMGLPRSGSTLLMNILQQNPNIFTSSSCPTTYLLEGAKQAASSVSEFIAMEQDQLDSSLTGYIKGGMDGWFSAMSDKPIAISKSRGWDRYLNFLFHAYKDPKFIVIIRDLRDIFASMEGNFRKNPEKSSGIVNWEQMSGTTVPKRVDVWAQSQPVGLAIERLQEVIRFGNDAKILFIKYEYLCLRPETEMIRVYQYLGIPFFKHNFDYIEQVTKEDDEVYGAFGDHQIRNELKLTPSKAKTLLGKQVCDWIYDNYRWFYEQFKYSK